jgi:hypothetical protein
MDGDAHDGSADDREVEGGVAVPDAAAIFSGDDIQPLMQAVFDAPIVPVR